MVYTQQSMVYISVKIVICVKSAVALSTEHSCADLVDLDQKLGIKR